MSSNQETFITTGDFMEESHQVVWKIKNWVAHQQSALSLAHQKFEIVVGKSAGTKSKWLVGFRANARENRSMIYFKLLETYNIAANLAAKINFDLMNNDDTIANTKLFQMMFVINDEVGEDWLGFNYTAESAWANVLDGDGAVTIKIRFTLTRTATVEICTPSEEIIKKFNETGLNQLKCSQANLLNNQSLSDVKFICGDGKEILAHKLVLTSRCPVFESMLRSDDFSEGKTGIVRVDDISEKTMRILLGYIYTGELPPNWNDADTIVELTYAAGKYQLTDILELLDNLIGKEEDSVCNIVLLSLAQKLGLQKAEAQLMKRIVNLTIEAKSGSDILKIYEDPKPSKSLPAHE